MKAGADIHKLNNQSVNPVYRAAQKGHADILKILIDAGGDVNQKSTSGSSSMKVAIEERFPECVKVLCNSKNIDLKYEWSPGQNYMWKAEKEGYHEIVEILK